MEHSRPLTALIFGVPRLDAQHEQLLQLARHMQAAFASGRPLGELRRLAAVLTLHVRLHFMDEEMFMEGAGFPGLAIHRRCHQEFTEGLLRLETSLHRGGRGNFQEIVEYELQWITHHLEEEDDQLGRWLRDNEILAAHLPEDALLAARPIPTISP